MFPSPILRWRGVPITSTYRAFAPATPPSPRHADALTLLGVVVAVLESTYLLASYMPLEENQFVAASVPARLGVSAVLAGVAVWKGVVRKEMSEEGRWDIVALAGVDAAAACWLGMKLGRCDGMVVDAERWL